MHQEVVVDPSPPRLKIRKVVGGGLGQIGSWWVTPSLPAVASDGGGGSGGACQAGLAADWSDGGGGLVFRVGWNLYDNWRMTLMLDLDPRA